MNAVLLRCKNIGRERLPYHSCTNISRTLPGRSRFAPVRIRWNTTGKGIVNEMKPLSVPKSISADTTSGVGIESTSAGGGPGTSVADVPESSTVVGIESADTPGVGLESIGASVDTPAYQDFISYNLWYSDAVPLYQYPVLPIQGFTEAIQYFADCPWWAAIIAITVVARMITLKLQIEQIKHAARMQELAPKIQEYREKQLKRNSQPGGGAAPGEVLTDSFKIYKDNNIDMLKGLKLNLLQAPVFVCFFFAIRLMCLRPEWQTELSTGGFGWITDLTLQDPLWILPLLTGLTVLLTMLVQFKSSAMQPGVAAKVGGVAIMLFIIFINLGFPAGLNLHFFCSTVLTGLVYLICLIGPVRSFLNIPPLPGKIPPKILPLTTTQTPPLTPQSILENKRRKKKT